MARQSGTSFESSHLHDLPLIPKDSAVDWCNFVLDVCAQYFVDHLIGGQGVEVKIDETVVAQCSPFIRFSHANTFPLNSQTCYIHDIVESLKLVRITL